MAASFLLALREGLEAALVIGIVFGALRKMNRLDLSPAVWWGVGLAMTASILAALGLIQLGAEFEGIGEQIFEGTAMLLAAGLLTWMIFWMQRQSSTIKQHLESNVRLSLKAGKNGLFWLAFLAVAREGLELVLFLFAAGMAASTSSTLSGGLLGLAVAVAAGWILFASTRRLSLKSFFQVTNVLLILFAAGLVAHGVHEFNEAGIIPGLIEPLWDTSAFLSTSNWLGSLLKALFGYNSSPSLTELLAYVAYFVVILFSLGRKERKTTISPQAI